MKKTFESFKAFCKRNKRSIITVAEYAGFIASLGIIVGCSYEIGYLDGVKDERINFLATMLKEKIESE